MTTACVIVAVGILVLGLFLVIIERTAERDEARAELEHRADLTDELASAVAMAELLADELSHADTTIRNLAEQVVGSNGTRLRVVPPVSEDDYWARLMKATDER